MKLSVDIELTTAQVEDLLHMCCTQNRPVGDVVASAVIRYSGNGYRPDAARLACLFSAESPSNRHSNPDINAIGVEGAKVEDEKVGNLANSRGRIRTHEVLGDIPAVITYMREGRYSEILGVVSSIHYQTNEWGIPKNTSKVLASGAMMCSMHSDPNNARHILGLLGDRFKDLKDIDGRIISHLYAVTGPRIYTLYDLAYGGIQEL